MRHVLLCLLSLILFSTALGEAQIFTLENGLTVVLDEMHFAPSAVVLVQYRVGSRNETPDIAGISHFTEHMMFNGTPDMPGQMFWQLVQKDGGSANGGTGQDLTTYFIYLPSSRLENALRMESDRMHNCLMDPDDIAQEIGVVTDEWRLYSDSPDGQLYQRARAEFYGDHPLGIPVIGYGETIAAYDEEKVRNYYETWYRPSNATLVVAGDFDTEEALELVEEYFGSIPCDGPVRDNVPEVGELTFPERIDMEYPAEADRFLIWFRGCSAESPDMPALFLLSAHFGAGRLGWIEREMVNGGLLSTGYASSPRGLDENPFSFHGVVQPGVDTDSVITLLTSEVFRVAEEPIDAARLSMLQEFMMARELSGVNTPVRQAYRHAYDISLLGGINGQREMLERAAELTPEDLMETASRYFTPDRMMVAVLHATDGASGAQGTSTAGTTETEVPEVTDWSGLNLSSDFELPLHSISHGVERFVLDNGLVLLVKEDHSFPNVEIMAALPMCIRREDPAKCGISSMTAELMLRGTDEIGYEAFHERLAVLGSSTWIQPLSNYSIANVYGLSEHAGTYFTSLADLLMRPAMGEEDFQSVKTRFLASLERSAESPFYMAYNGFEDIILEQGNQRYATLETAGSVTREEAEGWWRATVRPEGTVISIVGDITPEDALNLAEEHFGMWENPAEPLPELTELSFSQNGDTLVIPMPGKIQVAGMAGCMGPSFTADDYTAFRVMSGILGGGIGSRLGKNIRETQGLAYMVGARLDSPHSGSLSGNRFIGMLSTGAPLAERALGAMIGEFQRIARDGVEEEELLLEQSRTIGRNSIGFDSYDSQARYFAGCEAMGMPLDMDLATLRETAELTRDDIREAAAKYFGEEWFLVIAGGVNEELEPLQ
jgi:zinc protease